MTAVTAAGPARVDQAMRPLVEKLTARRNVPFARAFVLTDGAGDPVNLSGAALKLQVRLYGAQPGEALISLEGGAAEGEQGLSAIDPGIIDVWIDTTTLMLLPAAAEAGADAQFVYDLAVTLPGSVKQVWREGAFVLKPGVTQIISIRTTDGGDVRVTEDGSIRVLE